MLSYVHEGRHALLNKELVKQAVLRGAERRHDGVNHLLRARRVDCVRKRPEVRRLDEHRKFLGITEEKNVT